MKQQSTLMLFMSAAVLCAACAGPTSAERRASAAESIAALQAADFDKAKTEAEKVTEAMQHILNGLEFSDESREVIPAETDDDREWLPNPRQKNHPMPMPVDDPLFDTWRHMVSDVRALVNGEEGLSLAELAQLGDIKWDHPPSGYLDVGRMFSEPTEVVLDIGALEDIDHHEENADWALRKILGKYRAESMKHSISG